MSIPSFPKIQNLSPKSHNIFQNEVFIEEKLDGSQFAFGKINNELVMRSKGRQIIIDAPDHLFQNAITYIQLIQNKIPNNSIFYCEYIKQPKHNILTYNRIPKNTLCLFSMILNDKFIKNREILEEHANLFNIDIIPLLYHGKVNNIDEIKILMDRESYLGGPIIEGIVIKNYDLETIYGPTLLPITCGKLVREDFREVANTTWKKEHTAKGNLETLKEAFCTEARWHKAIQHLNEDNKLTLTPTDIGPLVKEIQKDVIEEEKENIKDALWTIFKEDFKRIAIRGFPEWYKNYLIEKTEDKI